MPLRRGISVSVGNRWDDGGVDDKRYQIFLSSTYADLTDERKAVIQAILDLGHLPAGMEMFPAANEDQMTLIREVIDQSDYYVVLVAGRYGSVSAEGISYTEQEYDYAVKKGVPVLGFVHASPEKIESGKTDQNDAARDSLDKFRAKVESRMVKHFTSAAELGGHVTSSLTRAFKSHQRVGWVRADMAMTVETQREILDLREQLANAKQQHETAQRALVEDTTELAQGADALQMSIQLHGKELTDRGWVQRREVHEVRTTWDSLFAFIGPVMVDEAPEDEVRQRAKWALYTLVPDEAQDSWEDWSSRELKIYTDEWDKVVAQYRALGLIDKGQKRRQLRDENKYLALTVKGDRHLAYLLAIRRDGKSGGSLSAEAAKAEPDREVE